MIKEKEKCPTCANDLISETRILDIEYMMNKVEGKDD